MKMKGSGKGSDLIKFYNFTPAMHCNKNTVCQNTFRFSLSKQAVPNFNSIASSIMPQYLVFQIYPGLEAHLKTSSSCAENDNY